MKITLKSAIFLWILLILNWFILNPTLDILLEIYLSNRGIEFHHFLRNGLGVPMLSFFSMIAVGSFIIIGKIKLSTFVKILIGYNLFWWVLELVTVYPINLILMKFNMSPRQRELILQIIFSTFCIIGIYVLNQMSKKIEQNSSEGTEPNAVVGSQDKLGAQQP